MLRSPRRKIDGRGVGCSIKLAENFSIFFEFRVTVSAAQRFLAFQAVQTETGHALCSSVNVTCLGEPSVLDELFKLWRDDLRACKVSGIMGIHVITSFMKCIISLVFND